MFRRTHTRIHAHVTMKSMCICKSVTCGSLVQKAWQSRSLVSTLTRCLHNLASPFDNVNSKFVPAHEKIEETLIGDLAEFIVEHPKLAILTGAGISTESGIPDYRSEGVGTYARTNSRPIQHQDFIKKPDIRKRYWARNFVGWPHFSSVLPNQTHKILNEWEKEGRIHWLITQNVDDLHYKAGSEKVTELHGSAHRVMCIFCDHKMSRSSLQELFISHNSSWDISKNAQMAADGDVQLTEEEIEGFLLPDCPKCGKDGLKPEIVFFGDSVAKHIVDNLKQKVGEADGLLVLGSSLEVYSGYRFALEAKSRGKNLAIVNIGATRGDHLTALKFKTKCSSILQEVNKYI